jgi:transposase-like protein
MTANLQNPIFTEETKAREWLEARVWPNGPVCPHCGNADHAKLKALQGKAHRPGLYQCADCREQFTVTVKTVFERSKIPLTKWLAALFLLTASKKGVSAHQIHRLLDISYKSAWFMMHRLREALRTGGLAPMGGSGKIVEVDETYIGKGQPVRRGGSTHKNTVLTLVERGGRARSFHIDSATIAQVAPIIRENIKRESRLMTDEANIYPEVGANFSSHDAVNHSEKEYVRDGAKFPEMTLDVITTNTVTAISRNMISATRTAPRLALTTTAAPKLPQRVSSASA